MAKARIDTLVDEIIALLNATDRTATYHNDDVMQVFDNEFREKLVGRHVWVMTNTEDQPSPASRAKTIATYSFWIVGVERYTGVGVPPVAWQRDRKYWMETIFDLLNDKTTFENITPKPYPVGVVWSDVMDKTAIVAHKLFWSDIILTLERVE